MGSEGFLRRWSRLKARGAATSTAATAPSGASMQAADDGKAIDLPPLAQTEPHPPFAPAPPAAPQRKPPTIDDVAALGPDSDFSAFVSQGVDKTVQRLAMKKLFSDPHFNIMDGLDVYIDDYTRADPIPAAMLASLEHARSTFARMLDDKADGQDGATSAHPDGAAGGSEQQPGGQGPAQPAPPPGQASGDPGQPDPPKQDDP